MKQIRENLFLGDITEANNLQLLKDNKITTILTVTYDNINAYHPQEIKRIQIALEDSNLNDNIMIELAVNTLDVLLDNNEKVFIHCAAGLSRSPFIIAMTLAVRENKSIRDYCDELNKLIPAINLNMWLNGK